MTITILLLIAVIIIALIFEFINGFHDCANAIATVVSTKVLSPKQAVLFGATFEFLGALTGTHVAKTIGAGIDFRQVHHMRLSEDSWGLQLLKQV